MMFWIFSLTAWLLSAGLALAQEPPLELLDEGTVLGKVRKLDCVGSGLVCSKSGNLGTINGSGVSNGISISVSSLGAGGLAFGSISTTFIAE